MGFWAKRENGKKKKKCIKGAGTDELVFRGHTTLTLKKKIRERGDLNGIYLKKMGGKNAYKIISAVCQFKGSELWGFKKMHDQGVL